MKIIADVAARYAALQQMADEGKTVNEDGTAIDAYLEIASELYEKPKGEVTFEERNHTIRIVRKALEAAVFADTIKAAQAKSTGRPFPWSPV